MGASDRPLLAVRGLEARYGSVQALWGIDFEVHRGEIVTLVGANGAGKTTTLRVLSGLLPASGGRVEYDGEPIHRLPPHAIVARGIVQVPEARQLWPRMTVEENLILGAYSPRARAKVRESLARVYDLFPRLRERRTQAAGTLSGGEQQMCAVGRGLMADPAVLLLDEPSLGLAPMLVDAVFEAIQAIARQAVTILLVEQNIHYALGIADRGYVLETGRVRLQGTGAQLLADDHVRRTYLGVR